MAAIDPKSIQALTPELEKAALMEKGGLFIVLMAVLYLGYNIYQTSNENQQKMVLQQLAAISQQQITLQQNMATVQSTVLASRESTQDILRKIEGIEDTMMRYVYYDEKSNTLVLRTPGRDSTVVNLQVSSKPANKGA
jgi:stage III sporulation protein SpoIIIAA